MNPVAIGRLGSEPPGWRRVALMIEAVAPSAGDRAQRYAQQLVRVRRRSDGRTVEDLLAPVAFVPLIGAQGCPVSPAPGSTASGV